MGGVGVGERRPLAEDVQADEDLDVRHLAELARVDQPEDLAGRAVVEVVVILDQRPPPASGVADQAVELVEGDRRRLLQDDVGPGVERGHGQRVVRGRRGGDVDHVGPDRLEHRPVVGVPAGRRRTARRPTRPSPGERSQTPATSTPGSSRRQARCWRAMCPAPIRAALMGSSPPRVWPGRGRGPLDDPGRDARPRRPRAGRRGGPRSAPRPSPPGRPGPRRGPGRRPPARRRPPGPATGPPSSRLPIVTPWRSVQLAPITRRRGRRCCRSARSSGPGRPGPTWGC